MTEPREAIICEECGRALAGIVELVDHYRNKHLPELPVVQHCPICETPMTGSDMCMPSIMLGNEWWIGEAGGVMRLTCVECMKTKVKVTAA
jgi:hypothetical protein